MHDVVYYTITLLSTVNCLNGRVSQVYWFSFPLLQPSEFSVCHEVL